MGLADVVIGGDAFSIVLTLLIIFLVLAILVLIKKL